MEKKIYIIENLDCANCAAKIEDKMNRHPLVKEAQLVFSTLQLHITAEDPDALLPELTALARTVEEGVIIRPREEGADASAHQEHPRAHGEGCAEHRHEHGEGCNCGGAHPDEMVEPAEKHRDKHGHETKLLLIGGVLFLVGLVLKGRSPWAVSLAVFLCAYWILGRNVVMTAVRNLSKGHVLDENFLMSLATVGAFLIGEYPEAVGVMLFYRIGEFFEHMAVERSRSQIMEAVDLRPETVWLMENDGIREVPAEQARVGDVLLVRPGDRIPLDGRIVAGQSRVDTAPVTGEPVPVRVGIGDQVISGCVNTTGQLTVRVEKILSESMVSRILDSVENAAASKPRMDRFITRFARIYTPVVVFGALAVAVIPSVVTGNWSYWIYTALTFLVMSCPCALVLSVPLTFFAGIGAGSKKGILFKGGQSMEAMSRIKTVIMDKTGTVTKGDFRVQKTEGPENLLALCASCEQHSSHPIAESIVLAARERGLVPEEPEALEELPGRGIRARVGGKEILCGSQRLLREAGVSFPKTKDFGTVVLVAVDGSYYGRLIISDTVKPGGETAVRRLREDGIATVMLTGDTETSAKAVAGQVGIQKVYAGLLPQQKLEQLRLIRKETGAVMFVGDGINDAPVLAGADVGAAMGSGADAAIEAADVVFMTSDMEAIPQSLEIARKTKAIAWQNVIFALAIKLAVMYLGIRGYASMWMAVFADSGVAMLCVLNSIRMLYSKRGE